MNRYFMVAMMSEFHRAYGIRSRSNNETYRDFCKAYTMGTYNGITSASYDR